MTQSTGGPTTEEAVCFRHTNRPTNVRCQNCDRPICADCMRESPVGYRCPDCAPQRRFALADDLAVTKAVIGVNVFVFVLGIVLQAIDGAGGSMLTGNGSSLATEGALIVSACAETTTTALGTVCSSQVGVAEGDWWRLFTSGFLHSGLLHIGLNMYFIWMFGRLLEPSLGRLRFGLLYTVSLLGGSIGAMLYAAPNVPTVGASGAAFGLLGAALVVSKLRRIDGLTSDLLMIAGLNFAIGFLPGLNISIGGHLGGFIAGGLAGYLAFGPLARNRSLVVAVLSVAVVVLFLGGLAVADMRAAA